ncbi:MAG: sulfotransferase [Sphingobium sp.]
MSITTLIREARQALSQGDLQRSAVAAGEAAKRAPDNAEAKFLIAMTLAEAGRVQVAIQALEDAVAIDPDKAEYHAQMARLLTLVRRERAARTAADAARSLSENSDALTLDTIGCVYARLSDHEAALPLFERAVALAPESVSFRFNLASSLGFFGKTQEAETQYEAIVALDLGFGRAHLGLSGLRRQTPEANHVTRLEQALKASDDPVEALRIHYAAAKEYEDLGDYEKSFAHLSTANAQHKKRRGFDLTADRANVAAIIECFSDPARFSGPSMIGDGPIFIVGMPRTGTTLVDSVLSAHRDVKSAGELQAMPLAIKRIAGTRSRLILDTETIAAAARHSPQMVGQDYLARARQHSGAESGIFTDKLPLNFLYIGYIARALPHAKIVCLRRNPMDTVWSNYKNLFATGSSYYGWSYDLMDTAGYYALFDRTMAFWRERFPGRVLELGYEALIADQEGETRRLLDHCGLSWDENCLKFYETTSAVATPSAQQVRNPLNARSVGKWRAYAHHLEPVRAWFAAQGIATD